MKEDLRSWKSDDIGDYSNVDNESTRELLQNENISKWRFPKIQKRYYITFLLFLFSFLDLHLMRNSIDALREAEIQEWMELEKHFDMNSMGIAVACCIGFIGVHSIGGAVFVGVGNLGKAILCLTFPVLLSIKIYPLIAHSFTFGFFQGLTYVGHYDMFARWSPPNERVRLITLASVGHGLAVATYDIIDTLSWQSLFHNNGFIILCMAIVWIIVVSSDPSKDKYISEEERIYLCEVNNFLPKKKARVPYRSILTSIPVYSLMSVIFISDLVTTFILSSPFYFGIADTFIKGSQLLTTITVELTPYLIQVFGAWFIDWLRSKRDGFSIDKIHKMSLFWGQSLSLAFLLIAAIGDDADENIKFFCVFLSKIAFGLSLLSIRVIVIDVGGQHAGVLKALLNFFRIFASYLFSRILSSFGWQFFLLSTTLLAIFVNTVFLKFGYGDLLPWAAIPDPGEATDDVDCEANTTGYKNLKEVW